MTSMVVLQEDVQRAQRLGFPSKRGGKAKGAPGGQGGRGAQGGSGQQQARGNKGGAGGRGRGNQGARITGSKRKEKEPSIATPVRTRASALTSLAHSLTRSLTRYLKQILTAEDIAKRELRKQRFATDTDAKRQKTQDE